MAINPGCGVEKMEENMKIKEFMKNVAASIVTMILLLAFFQPVCTKNGDCNHLMLWFLAGIPLGLGHLFMLVILKDHDTGGTMAILFLNLVLVGIIGGMILTCRLLMATGYLVEAMTAGIVKMAKIGCRKR